MRRPLTCAAALLIAGFIAQLGHAPPARAAASAPEPPPRTAGRAPVPGSTPRPTSARAAAAAALEFPADPKNFGRHHAPPVRPVRRAAAAHKILSRPLHAIRSLRSHGVRGGAPAVSPGAIDPRKAPSHAGPIVAAYMRRHPSTPSPTPTPVTLSHRRAAMTPGTKRTASIDITQQNSTGINHWWSYEEGGIPGVGRWMINAYTGNLIVQADDMDVPHRGVDLAFRRTYNSFSEHNFAGYDGANEVGQYGNGWTNTWDAHLSTNGCPNTGYAWAGFYGFSVHDVDGARYDYCFDSTGQLIPPTGMQGTSLVVSPDGGSFYWTKKTGTQYTFYAPYYSGTSAAYSGRIYRISGRNQNNYIQFTYAWSPDASSSANLTNIYAATDNGGSQATLTFQNFSGQQLLAQLTRPDGATITYDYDTSGELISVSKPAPNNTGTPVVETYNGYQSFLMIAGPRWNAGGENDGGYVAFYMDETTTAQVDGIEWVGVMNFQPSDGTSTLLQPAVATGPILYAWEDVRVTPTYTSFSDTDGHSVVQYLDGAGRPTAREEYTGSQWLQTTEGWDASNDLVSSTDQRGYETDYLYDPMGNTTAVAEPYTTTSQGSFRPTKLYDYDADNNVIAYCDEKASHANGGRGDWTSAGPPTSGAPDALCASNGSSAHAVFTYPLNPAPPYEPFGQLTSIRSPLGYTRTIGYDPSKQGGADYGLPTSIRGSAIAQTDGTRTPYQTITYDASGNILCASTDGNDPTTTTLLVYDTLNRVVARGDPDDASVTNGCAKTPGIAGSAIATRMTYFPNGQVATTTTPAEAAANVSTQFQYDLDGDVISEQHHFVAGAGPTQKWYDGADRLIEVQQPTDANDFYTFPWRTRYLYDLTQGGTVTIASSAPYRAYGGLYKTQEQLPNGVTTPQWNEADSVNGPSTGTSNPTWQDTAGTAFDALDRAVTAYRNTGNGLMPVTNVYDGAGSAGLLSQKCNANNECITYTYDPRGAKSQATFNVSTSSTQNFSYDEDGHVAAASNGVGSFNDAYDADGRKTSRQETVGATSATIGYAYYDDGLRKSLDAVTGTQNLPAVLTYTYRPDGLIRQLGVASTYTFSFAYTGGRRLTSRSDNTGQAANNVTYTGGGSPTSYGLAQSMTTAGFYETGMTYNAEGGQLGGTYYGFNGSGWFPGRLIQAAYTSRGEVVTDTSGSATPSLYANGTRIQTARSPSDPKTASFTFNALQGMTIATQSASKCAQGTCESTPWAYGYDPAGRQTTAQTSDYTNAKSYDAEDHLLTQTLPWIPYAKSGYQRSLGYQWGPIGHPLQVGSTSAVSTFNPPPTDFQYDTLVWDDDDVLFTVNSAGQIDDLKVADFADYVPGASNALTVWDRDINGQIYGCHTSGGALNISSSAFQQTAISCGAPVSFVSPGFAPNQTPVGRGGMLLIPKSDGFSDGQNTFQGVRTYDPQAGTWTTPDAYHGDVHDPMSQKPYMWNRNNPYSYEDPSGYETGEISAKYSPGNFSPAKVTGGEEFKQALSDFLDAAATVVLLWAERGAAGKGSSDAAADAKLGEAIQARDALAEKVLRLGGQPPAVVTAGYNRLTGKVAAACSGGKLCAERHVENALGVDPSLIQFTKAIRPRTGKEQAICSRCQQRYGRSQFPPGTSFEPQ